MLSEDDEQDLREAVAARLAALVEDVRRRREDRLRFAAEKKTRRDAGLRARHNRKINRSKED